MDEAKLRRYLTKYKLDQKQAHDLATKNANYIEAMKVLVSLQKLKNPTEQEFIALYGRLIGASGMKKLWHSGSVFRTKGSVAQHRNEVIAMISALIENLERPIDAVYREGLDRARKIKGLGPNILTEILNTQAPQRFAVLNKNPLTSLAELGFKKYPGPEGFKPSTYAEYCEFMSQLAKFCGFANLSDLDHFLNFVYWKVRETTKKRKTRPSSIGHHRSVLRS